MDSSASVWDTTLIYPSPDSPVVANDLATTENELREFRNRYHSKVAGLDAAAMARALRELEQLHERLVRLQSYSYLLFSADSSCDLNKNFSQKVAEFANLAERETLFFTLEIMEMTDPAFDELTSAPLLADVRHFLEGIRKFRPFRLPEREEQLLCQKALTGSDAFTRLYDEFSSSLTYPLVVDGETRELTAEEILSLLHHPDPELRERAFTTFLENQGNQSLLFTTVFNTILLDHGQNLEIRGYHDPIQPTNIGNELPDDVVERLLRVSEENYPLAQRFFRLKGKILGLPALKNSDIYAPVPGTDRTFTFDLARDLVLEAAGEFHPPYREILEKFFDERRIDTLPRPGKGGGAYCMGISPSLSPFVLLNFTGNQRDVATLAHELGHGLHYVLASRQRLLNYHAPLPLAETASTFMEMVLAHRLINNEADRTARISLLCAQAEDIIATTFRQTVLTRFEQQIHGERKHGLLPADRISELWLEENRKLYGDAVRMLPSYRWGWTYISHFIHSRFYCYSYVFAELLVLSLFKAYRTEGASFIPRFDAILSSGGSLGPVETLAAAGVDIRDSGFWQQGYDLLAEIVDELESLTDGFRNETTTAAGTATGK